VDFTAVAKEQYHSLELKLTIDATDGRVELRWNGAALLGCTGTTLRYPRDVPARYSGSAGTDWLGRISP
jgi:hypothetical protein